MINHPNRGKAARKPALASTSKAPRHNHDHDYSALLTSVMASFSAAVARGRPLFTTDAAGLNDAYLDMLPSERQVHTCHCCRRFIGTYGNLVQISESGELWPVMWNPEGVPAFYRPAFAALHERVRKARVESVFLTKATTWGTPVTGDWSHLSVSPTAALVYRERALTAEQAMAAARENFRTVATALGEFTAPMLDEAMRLFSADQLARSEKFIGPVKWLRALHDRPKGRLGVNVLWQAVATAPEGYCHPKASVLGPLLDDIAAGKPFEAIKRNFDAKLGPLLYQRPQAAPTAGNIKAAEALVEKLGIARSLERRFARPDEVEAWWTPDTGKVEANAGGVFGHLKPKGARTVPPVDLPSQTMTWEKFTRTVMPTAERLEFLVPSHGRFIALTTAEHADAPLIFKWDNPVAWYVYPGGSTARQWGLLERSWAPVTAVASLPTLWGDRPMPFLGEGDVLVLEGAMDSHTEAGNALFPECLREEMYGARATIEAYSRHAQIGGRVAPVASGYDIRKSNSGSSVECRLRVFAAGAWSGYHIDRWD